MKLLGNVKLRLPYWDRDICNSDSAAVKAFMNETKKERTKRNKKKNKRVSHLLSLVRVKLRKGKDKHGQTLRHADKQSQWMYVIEPVWDRAFISCYASPKTKILVWP